MGTMRAAQYSKYHGGPLALEIVDSVEVPTPSDGELLVKVEASSVNAIDWKIQDGLLRPFLPRTFPHIPGTDITGMVVIVGPGVEGFARGDEVISCLNLSKSGALAEYALAPASSTVKRPSSMSPEIAASLPVAGMTALQSAIQLVGLKFDGSGPKFNVLITAASGGVGLFWVQIAKLTGCFVTATCGARNMDLLKSLGADEVLDYKTPEGASYKSPSGKKYDVVVHLAPYQPMKAFESELSERGFVVDMTPTLKTWVQNWYQKITFSKRRFLPFVLDSKIVEYLQIVTDLVEEGALKVVIDSTFTLTHASHAWARSIEGHCTGKVVVFMNLPLPHRLDEVDMKSKVWEWLLRIN